MHVFTRILKKSAKKMRKKDFDRQKSAIAPFSRLFMRKSCVLRIVLAVDIPQHTLSPACKRNDLFACRSP